jgi:undecaprenyl pyrophosphate phosphatase UppP
VRRIKFYTAAVLLSIISAYFVIKSLLQSIESLDIDFSDEDDNEF